eukprot:m.650084 g.650084  ORF g.650084 m.650084 type:complete len:354 (+) comp22669_c0_seq1:255-1316(+)
MDPLADPMDIISTTIPFIPSQEMVLAESPATSALDAESSGRKDRKSKTIKKKNSLQKLFEDLPDDDSVVDEYLCAWQREILIQGRAYATMHHLCFYSNILGWENRLKVKWTDIKALKKGNTMAVIPNAIQVFTSDGNSFTLTSFLLRNRAFKCFSWLWENAVSAEPRPLDEVMALANGKWGKVVVNSRGIHVGTLGKNTRNADQFSNRNDAFDPATAPSAPSSPRQPVVEHRGAEESATEDDHSDNPPDLDVHEASPAPENPGSISGGGHAAGTTSVSPGLTPSAPLPSTFGQELWRDNPGDVLHDATYDLDLDTVFKRLFQDTTPGAWLLKVFDRQKTTGFCALLTIICHAI